MKYSFLWATSGLLLAGFQISACSDDEPSARTRAEFCEDWAEAACSNDTLMACQASGQDNCRVAQQAFCQDLVPVNFSDARGDDCIDAVRDAYEDADLTGSEFNTVRRLGGECSGIVTGPRTLGQTCETDLDCDASTGVQCVYRGGMRDGTCEVPEEVGPGQPCSEPAQTCGEGFFCDGSNCIASRAAGAACQNDVECAPAGYCSSNDACVARLTAGSTCVSDNDCQSLLCYDIAGDRTCADLVRLSPAEDVCGDLR